MKQYTFDYSRNYYPAAPIIEIKLRSPYRVSEGLQAFVDSGADCTIVPLTVLQSINANYADKGYITGTTGVQQSVGLYEIQVQVGNDIIYGIDAAAYGEEIILGRDVLNQITILLDGPLAVCEITI